ncbi:MAG: MopE-related protein [Chitinophagales bacterium]
MKTILFICCAWAFPICAFNQLPVLVWQNTIGADDVDYYRSAESTVDGGSVLAGSTESGISGDKTEAGYGDDDYWLIKVDADGNVLWDKSIGGEEDDYCKVARATSDGGYIIAGYSDSDSSGLKTQNSIGFNDFWIVKLNNALEVEWDKTIGGSANDLLSDIQQTTDGGYIIGGSSKSDACEYKSENARGDQDYWVIKLNNSGDIEWDKTLGGSGLDILNEVLPAADGGYLISGSSYSDISGDKTENNFSDSADIWMIKLNTIGEVEWQNTIGGGSEDRINSAIQIADGGFMLAGLSSSDASADKSENTVGYGYDIDVWIIKLDSEGNIEWDNTIGGNGDDGAKSIYPTSDGGYLIGAYSISDISGDKTEGSVLHSTDYWVIKTDVMGNVIWDKTLGGGEYETLRSAREVAPNHYVVGGSSYSGISGDKTEADLGGPGDFWIVMLSDECIESTWYADADGDGFGDAGTTVIACEPPAGYVADFSDCNDADNAVIPGGSEICNAIDDNCDGNIDEGVLIAFYADADGDGFGTSDLIIYDCTAPAGYSSSDMDCDDAANSVNPDAEEILNGVDDNCDGAIDEGLTSTDDISLSVKLYPNPVNELLTINCASSKGFILSIYDCNGKLIFKNSYYTENNIVLDMHDYAPGIYQLVLISEAGMAARSIIKD